MDVRIFLFVCLLHLVHSKVLQLSCGHIKALVEGHNSRRLSLAKGEVPNQPAASNMKYMIWDKELAEKAAKWSNSNEFTHNSDITVGSKRFFTIDNIYKVSSTDPKLKLNINDVLDVWFSENVDFEFGPLSASNFEQKPVGHYTQMAWADTVYVGCGASANKKDGKYEYILVCNYGPAGNIYDEAPYKTGDSSGELTCSGDCSKKYGDEC